MSRLTVVVASACALSLMALGWFVHQHAYTLYDDAFIYLRYVKNVRAGCGLRFNCSEPRVEGFSSALWLLLLVLGGQVTHKLVTVTQVVGTASLAGLLVAAPLAAAQTHGAESVSSRRRAAAAVLVAALLALDHYTLLNAVIGLETGLAGAIGVLVYAAVSADRRRSAFALAFVMFLLRPEGALFVLGLFVLPWARTRRFVAACAVGFAAIALVRWLVFHDVVPNTVWAKAGGTARHVELGLLYLGTVARDFPAVLTAPLALLWPAARRHVTYLLATSAAWFVGLVYAGGDTFEYGRLAFPLIPALTVCGVQGALAFSERLVLRRRRVAGLMVALLLFVIATRASIAHSMTPSNGFRNVARWTKTGQFLKLHYPGKRVATVPVGAIGYFSELEVLDLVGLTSPTIAKARRSVPADRLTSTWIGHERHHLEYSLAWAPDLLITTKYRSFPWLTLDEASAGFYADWLFLRAVKEGLADYHVEDLEIVPGLHVLALARDDQAPAP